MNELIELFKTKAAIARTLEVSGPAVSRAFKRGEIPSTWVPKLIAKGVSQAQLASMPVAKNAANILSALPQQG
jgi:hypothetical protein